VVLLVMAVAGGAAGAAPPTTWVMVFDPELATQTLPAKSMAMPAGVE
jgi:hypothetical protein